MLRGFKFVLLTSIMIISLVSCGNNNSNADNGLLESTNGSGLKAPKGFNITYFAKDVENARSMSLSPSGILFVGTRDEGNVYAVVDTNKDYKADKTYTLAKGLNMPNGVAFHNGSLYVAEVNRLLRFDNIENNLSNPPSYVVVYDKYPSDAHHGWKFIRIGPDNKMYIPVGAPCNVCLEENKIYSSITNINLDGSDMKIFAEGIRNTVGFDWHPVTKELWFTDNGRDMLGDNTPPDELNKAPKEGMHFGFPHQHGMNITDPEFGKNVDFNKFTKPEKELGPHVAALGMRFYTGNMFPAEYKNQIFIAEHGSWNRSEKIGYRITLVKLDEGGKVLSYDTFIEGWLKNGNVSGRPVDIELLPDGSMLISDDYANCIYRVTYNQ